MKASFLAAIAAFAFVSAGECATPLQDCAGSPATTTCLDAKLKAANQKLNATLKSAQERLERLQVQGRRPVVGAFIDSQRKFNAYRDAQCTWQGVRAPNPASGADYVKDCQIRATIAREQELADFVAGEETTVAAAPAAAPRIDVVRTPEPAVPVPQSQATEQQAGVADAPPVVVKPFVPEPAASPADKPIGPDAVVSAPRANEWHLVKWIANGTEKAIVTDSSVTIAFDPSGKISGSASVNRYSGTYRFDVDGRLKWPPGGFALTRMAGPPALMTQERAFLDALKRTSVYKIESQQLVLESTNASVTLVFTR